NIHIDDVKETCLKINYKTVEIGKISLLSNVCIESLNILQISIQIIIGSYLIYINKLDINSFITFLLYSQQITSSINILTQANGIISRMIVSLNRILELLDEKIYEVEIFGDEKINSNITDIEFCNVSFSYNNRKKILDNINFKIDKKSKIAIVGKSGEGKSTILNLITKLYSPDEGLIKINNININNISEKEIRDKISVVNQEPFLFNKTIKENFLMVNSNAKEKDIIQACKEAHIYNFIKNLPKGLDTIVGENGANLSVGQKQRLAIARILIKECNIILLDEITSSLDNESQFFINKTIQSLSKKYTIITVTHKISNITNYDKILILNNKKIEDIGTHTELMIRNSLYKNLYQKELNN
ncbi:ABC transporter ATP-binding protein, partial [Clostridium perfringens]